MTLELALRLSEILLALAFCQQAIEQIRSVYGQLSANAARLILCGFILIGIGAPFALLGLFALGLYDLYRFQGPYNGGADRMGMLILSALTLIAFLPDERWKTFVLGYLAVQVVLSYFISGAVKVVEREWRSGCALRDVFLFSSYPVSDDLRALASRPRLLCFAGWFVIIFELAFPLFLLWQPALIMALGIGFIFHLANAFLFGLNRFIWVWIASYPSILWLQDRIFIN
ncbi:MAG: HTTM domain-containing protein [Micavibrio sp.]|nr:HTTM domain-containing protein [Micavibrio sp.]